MHLITTWGLIKWEGGAEWGGGGGSGGWGGPQWDYMEGVGVR